MAKHDLTGSLEKKFTFSINENEYEFRKPTVREARELSRKFQAVSAAAEEDSEKVAQEAMDSLYSFIEPLNGSRPIADALEDEPVAVQVAFNAMIQSELGA